ncbi:phage shock protein C, PspC [Phocaeicola salanitronis DSM 18170]|jgi:phage shock protein C|uniref:Phage shock protein C, PspC n=1 Tax=Phocaeicola salanitronis (strain DSM 18170 / JCM 13657 / CCUG 60908 / BL78) TaxID=667015 RepID=F0R1D5_PHOSB|nr:PspC domain-containing protein [Phocaeicola salanitronis]ADY37379.1 phage shock protein C, PspC [Phocaeicola salanitronis DSM 18170]
MEGKKLTRPQSNKMLAGVCAGIANYFNLDPTLIRVIYALLTVFTAFAGIIVYLLLWIIIPEDK